MTRRVVVVGAGLAGWCAAVAAAEAAEAGGRVVLLEKTPRPGGSTVLSGGFMAFAGTDEQAAQDVVDGPDLLTSDLLEVGQHLNDPALVAAYAHQQPALVAWLRGHGMRVLDLEQSAGQSVPRSHRVDPVALVADLERAGARLGVEQRTSAAVTSLMVQDGVVTGVGCGDDVLDADAVVLATGGFSRSESMLAELAPGQAGALRVGGDGSTGDGLRLAVDAGAGLRDVEHVKGTFGAHPTSGNDRHQLLLAYYLGAVVVDAGGERFVDESISYKLLGDACLGRPGGIAYQVFDEAVMDAAPRGVPLFDPRPLLSRGLVVGAPSLAVLAAEIGVPVETFERTIAAYNRAAHGEEADPFGRRHLVAGSGDLVPVERPPYYAFASTSVVLATYCGVTIDPSARVLDRDGQVVPGLLAAGEVTGGFHGAAYMTGSSLGKAALFGHVAGRVAAGADATVTA